VGLLNAGIPFAACMAFLLASPLLNPVILSLLAALIGPVPTAAYAVITFCAAIVLATLLGRFGFERYVKGVTVEGMTVAPGCGCEGGTFAERHGPRFSAALHFAVALLRLVFPYLLRGAAIGAFV